MANTVNELFEKIINERSKFISQHDYKLFSNFKRINKSSFGTVRTAKWRNSIIVLKSLNIDTEEIISNGIITEITKIINNKTIPKTILNESITNETSASEAITNETITNEAIISETTNEKFIRLFINENIRLSFTDDKYISHEKWIEFKINEGLITKYKFDEFTEFKMIGSGSFSIVYKTSLKITGGTYALKIIHNNKYTDKEIVNE
ncbi:5019_t:CDS:2, partial [Gigaspora margarita]